MALARGIARPLLFFSLIAVIAAANVAEAGLLDGFKGIFKGVMNQVNGLVAKVAEDTAKKFSVLGNFFGNGVTRGDLTLPQIFNGVFSRNNSIIVANSTTTNQDWQLGDGSSVIAAISSGGSLSVTNDGGKVSLTTGTHKSPQSSTNDEERETKEEDEKEDAPSENDNGTVEEPVEPEETPEERENGTETFTGSDLDSAFIQLLSNWQSFVTSSIWDIQEEENEPEPSSEREGEEDSLKSSTRVVNGVFLGNRIASGAPFSVKFFYNNEENFYCSGSLIGYPYVLTAAHCGIVLDDEVRVGGRLLRSGYKATVAEVFNHPDFDSTTLAHDIAIVRLDGLESKEKMKENGVKAARVNKNETFPETGFVGILSGHGSAETDGRGVSDELRSTRHTVYDIEKCMTEITQGDIEDDESYLCAGDGERSTTCVGDSGAGLWHYRVKKTASGKTRRFYEIFGVVSFGEVTDEALCPRGPPTVFQRTSENYDWIVKVVGRKNIP